MLTEEQRAENRRLSIIAEQNAKKILKPGDRLRVTKCPGTKRWITFKEWDGHWIVSKSGINDYSPSCVDMLNDKSVDFTKTPNAMQQKETTDILSRLGDALNPCADYIVTVGDLADAIVELEALRKLATFLQTAAQEAAEEFTSTEALLITEREIKTDYGRRIDDLSAQITTLQARLEAAEKDAGITSKEGEGMPKSETDWYGKYIEARDTIQQQAERIRELEIALEDSTVAIGQIAYLKQQLSEVVEYALAKDAALMECAKVNSLDRPMHCQTIVNEVMAIPLPKAMQG